MKEAFVIGASLNLTGNADKSLAKIAGNLTKTDKLLKTLKANFIELGTVLSGVSKSFSELSGTVAEVNQSTRWLNQTFKTFNYRLGATSYKMDTVAIKAAKLKAAMEGVGESVGAANIAMSPIRGGSGGAGKSHGGIHAHSWTVGAFGYKPTTLGAAAAGYAAYEGYKYNAQYAREFAQFQAMNLGSTANSAANQFSLDSRYPGISSAETMKLLREATVIMKGNYGEAEQIVPLLAKMKFASNALGYSVNDDDFMKIMRVAEVRGGFKSPQAMFNQLGYAMQGISAFGNTVTPTDMQSFMRRGGLAAQSLSDKAFWLEALPIIQELGGHQTGTALMSLYQALGVGKTTTASALELQRLGLIKPGYAKYNKIGMIQRIKPGGIVGNELLRTNFADWIFDVLTPTLNKKGFNTQDSIEQEVATILGNRTAANLAAKVIVQSQKIQQETGLASHAMTAGQLYKLGLNLPQGRMEILAGSFDNLALALGKITSPLIISGMDAITKFLNAMTNGINAATYLANKAVANVQNGTHKLSFSESIFSAISGSNLKSNTTQNLVPQPSNLPQQTLAHTTVLKVNENVLGKATTTFQGNSMSRWHNTGTSGSDNTVSAMFPVSRA